MFPSPKFSAAVQLKNGYYFLARDTVERLKKDGLGNVAWAEPATTEDTVVLVSNKDFEDYRALEEKLKKAIETGNRSVLDALVSKLVKLRDMAVPFEVQPWSNTLPEPLYQKVKAALQN